MLRNYLITAIRNIKRHKAFSIINIMGLAIGMAVCMIIMLYVQSELSYDKFHKDYNKIFRVQVKSGNEMDIKTGYGEITLTPAMLMEIISEKYSTVNSIARIRYYDPDGISYKYNGNPAIEKSYLVVDPSFFDVFDFKFAAGNKTDAMPDLNSMVVTESFSAKCFGNSNPIGKIISVGKKRF